ncbi:MAG: hypothetical protein HY260_22390 [Chloroflexi bacterium]|nr:hypothetical protein [Chloroflexota bacterium]
MTEHNGPATPAGGCIAPGQATSPLGASPGGPGGREHAGRLVLSALALIGDLAGAHVLLLDLTTDPIADARPYCDAAPPSQRGGCLLVYMLMTQVAAVREPDPSGPDSGWRRGLVPDAAEAYVASAL